MKVGFVIRFHYPEDSPKFKWRYEHFVKEVLPRIKAQTYKKFSIHIWCNDFHKHLFESLGLQTFSAVDKTAYKISKNGRKKFFHDFVSFEETNGLPKLDVQVGLDSDDYITPNYLATAMEQIMFFKKQNPEKSTHICFQPQLLWFESKRIESMRRYHSTSGSAFMVLYQPINDKYRFIYSRSHISIIEEADNKMIFPEGYCFAVAHEHNESTGK